MNETFDDSSCSCHAAELSLGYAFLQIWQRSINGAADIIASSITERSTLAVAAIALYLFLALCHLSAIRRSYRNPTKIWFNDVLAILGYTAGFAFVPTYALHIRSSISTAFNTADLGYLCIVFMAFTIFNETCQTRVIDYKGRMYRVEMVDVARMGRMSERDDRDQVGFDEFWGLASGKETP